MSAIRPMTPADVPQVASLYELIFRSRTPRAAPKLAPYFERILLRNPWFDPEVPSLVYEADRGRIVGFIGSHVRRMSFEGARVRLAVPSTFISDPRERNRTAGAFLLRRFLSGPQDLTITDGATVPVQRIWERLGGHTAHFRSLAWTRMYRPFRFTGEYLSRRRGSRSARRWGRMVAPLDLPARAVPRLRSQPPDDSLSAEELTPARLVAALPDMVTGRLRPDYDQDFLGWLFAEMARVATRGDLVRKLVRGSDGAAMGWYVAYLMDSGPCEVMQIMAGAQGVEPVLDHLLHTADQMGATAVQGAVDGRLLEAVSRRGAFLHLSARTLIHSRRQELVNAALGDDMMLTRMDGERWMGFHREPFQ